MDAVVRRWDVQHDGEMSLAAIKARYQPSARFRVSTRTYLAGEVHSGAMRYCVCYALDGVCSFELASGGRIELKRGEFAELPSGDYRVRSVGAEPAEVVLVWELPADFA